MQQSHLRSELREADLRFRSDRRKLMADVGPKLHNLRLNDTESRLDTIEPCLEILEAFGQILKVLHLFFERGDSLYERSWLHCRLLLEGHDVRGPGRIVGEQRRR
ncbi:MAG TPA: hypothetical protein VI485_27715 [Vicinamibacterales bacterium]|nr:hypothetical protein [Vicinamibacterales bacterium]